jgi:polyferredoxin
MNNKILVILATMLIILPISVFATTWLWNTQLVPAIDGINQVNPLQMFGIMVLFYILYPGQKSTELLKSKKND